MRSGLESTSFDNYGTWVRSPNWVRFVLERPMVSDPGSAVDYSTGSSHVLSAILTQATGKDTWRFAQEALATPLGITLSPWPRDPQGIYFGGNEMLMTVRQMLAFGELYLHRGRAGGRQIVPQAWVDTSCEGRGRSQFNPDQLYGYGWWIRDFHGREGCFAWGYGGQDIFVFRDLDLVVVTTSATTADAERRSTGARYWSWSRITSSIRWPPPVRNEPSQAAHRLNAKARFYCPVSRKRRSVWGSRIAARFFTLECPIKEEACVLFTLQRLPSRSPC